jgi:hypothetical protein
MCTIWQQWEGPEKSARNGNGRNKISIEIEGERQFVLVFHIAARKLFSDECRRI